MTVGDRRGSDNICQYVPKNVTALRAENPQCVDIWLDLTYNRGEDRKRTFRSVVTEHAMLIKPGVDISRLSRKIRRILNILDRTYRNYGDALVITSTYEGTHSPSSLHYANDAIDIRIPARELKMILAEIKTNIGKSYDVIREIDHIHIEYDPKK